MTTGQENLNNFITHKLRRYSGFLVLSALTWGLITLNGCGKSDLPEGEKEFAAGVLALELGDTAAAHRLFFEAEQNDPGKPWRKLGAAREIELYSSPFGATKTYLELISLTPDFDSAYVGYCRLALSSGKTQLAWTTLQLYARNRGVTDATTFAGDNSARRNYDLILAKILQMRGQVYKAESRLQDLSKSLPNDGEVVIALASTILQQGRTAEAVSLVEAAVEKNSKRRDVTVAAINLFVDAGYAEKAIALLASVRENESPKNIWANNLALRTYLRLGYLDYASFTLSQMKIQGAPEMLTTYLDAVVSEANGNPYMAKERFLYSLPLSNRNMEIFRDAARASVGARNFIEMEDNMSVLMQYMAKSNFPAEYIADGYLDYAEFYSSLRQWQSVFSELEKARSIFGGTPRLELLQAQARYASSGKRYLGELFSSLSDKNPESFEWQRGLGLALAAVGEFDLAEPHIDKALSLQSKDFVSLLARVDLSRKKADSAGYAEAVANLTRLYPQNKRALRIHSNYYQSIGDNVSSLDIANRMIELYSGDLSAYNYAAGLAGTSYGSEQGLKYLHNAQANNPGIPAPHRKLASYFLRQGAVDSAEFYWSKANELDPTDIATLLTKGVIFEAKGFSDSAVGVYKRIIERDPFSADAFNNLAWVMANNDIRPAEASNIARQAINLSGGGNGNMYGTLGWALFKQKKYPEAKSSLQLAIKFDPADPFKRFLFGSILEEWGKKDEASEQFQHALDLGISGNYRKVVTEALSRLKS